MAKQVTTLQIEQGQRVVDNGDRSLDLITIAAKKQKVREQPVELDAKEDDE